MLLAAALALPAQFADRITADALKADVSFLASDALEGRGTPSRGLDVAGEYIAAQFRRAGLEPAGDDGYFQTASFVSETPDTEGLALRLEFDGRTVTADHARMQLDQPAALDLKQVPAIAIELKNFDISSTLRPEQVRGKAVLLLIPPSAPNGILRGIASAVAWFEPAVVIALRESAPQPAFHAPLHEVSAGYAPTPILSVWDPAVRDAIRAGGSSTITLHIPAPHITPVKLRNVVGVLRGSDAALKDTYVLLTAHYDHLGIGGTGEGDHIFNGANDDASGTASVVEIADALAAQARRPRRSIVFVALFGEEVGLLGSRYYARHPIFPLAKTIADINLEQMGRTDDSQGPHVGMFNLTGFDFTDMPAVFRKAAAPIGIRVVKDEKNSDPFFTRSDNAAFAAAGIPSTTISVAYVYPDYHGAGDEWPKLDYANMAKVDSAIAAAISAIADSPSEPQWNAANPQVERFVKAKAALSR